MTANGNTTPLAERTSSRLSHSIEEINTRIAPWPEETQEAIRRLFIVGRTTGLSLAGLGQIIDRDPSVVSKLFTGKYEAENLAPITEIINASLDKFQAALPSEIIAETQTVADIAELCLLAWVKHRIGFIFGPTQAGKSKGLEHFVRTHPTHPLAHKGRTGSVRALEMPAGGSARGFLNRLAVAFYRSPQSNWADLKRRIFEGVSPDDLIIIDEFSQCFNPVTGTVRIATLDLIRELWNTCKCGIVLVMTDVARDAMQQGRFHKACDQLYYRSAAELELSRVPQDADLRLIAQAHGLPNPSRDFMERIRKIVQTRGMTRFTTLLEMAGDEASSRKAKPTWTDFLTVHDIVSRLALNPNNPTK